MMEAESTRSTFSDFCKVSSMIRMNSKDATRIANAIRSSTAPWRCSSTKYSRRSSHICLGDGHWHEVALADTASEGASGAGAPSMAPRLPTRLK